MTISTEPGPVAAGSDEPTERPQRSQGLVWIAAALILGLLIGFGGAYLARAPRNPADNSAEAGFLRDMSTHHGQAVAMAMIAHADSSNPQIITLAGDIGLTQQAQIGYMQAWLRDWDLSPSGSQPAMAWMPDSAGSLVDGLMPGMATPEQLAKLRAATGPALDIQFLTLMRAHHLGGIHMAQEILQLTKDKNITWLAQTMVQNQQGELNIINDLLATLPKS